MVILSLFKPKMAEKCRFWQARIPSSPTSGVCLWWWRGYTVPIPREQSAVLPRLARRNGSRQKLSSFTAKVVEKKRLRRWVRQFIAQRILDVRDDRDEQTQIKSICGARADIKTSMSARIANSRISIKKRSFSVENGRFLLYKENPQIVWGFKNRLLPKWYWKRTPFC